MFVSVSKGWFLLRLVCLTFKFFVGDPAVVCDYHMIFKFFEENSAVCSMIAVPYFGQWLMFTCVQQTEDDIAEIENDIRGLKEAIRLKMYPAKLAQTRLENRTYRPNMEMCCDAPQMGLMEEVKQVEVTKEALEEELRKHLWVTVLNCSVSASNFKGIDALCLTAMVISYSLGRR